MEDYIAVFTAHMKLYNKQFSWNKSSHNIVYNSIKYNAKNIYQDISNLNKLIVLMDSILVSFSTKLCVN